MIHANVAFGDNFLSLVDDMVEKKYIRVQVHPDYPYRIFNYAESAVFDREWNTATLNARGLILDPFGDILARPFKKFFNRGEVGAAEFLADDEVIAFDKRDGSLGIIYATPDGPAVATRGSFTSDQAIHATKVLRERYADWADEWLSTSDFPSTPLVEIIYPENRIVVDYGGQDDLVLLGAIFHHSGGFLTPGVMGYPGPTVGTLGAMTFTEALSLPDRDGKEGMVLYNFRTEDRIKIKQEDYIRLHRIVTGLNARAVWEMMKDGKAIHEIVEDIPNEFHEFVDTVWCSVLDEYDRIIMHVEDLWDTITRNGTPEYWKANRREFAEFAKKTDHPGFLFAKLDGKEYKNKVWQMVRPEGNWTPTGRSFGEDTA